MGAGVGLTTLAGYELADLTAVGAVNIGVEGGEAGDGDIFREEVEFGDSVPNIGLGWELKVECQTEALSRFEKCETYHVDDEDLRRNWAFFFVSSFLDISCFDRRCDNGCHKHQGCKQHAPTVVEMHCFNSEEFARQLIEVSKDRSVRRWAVSEEGGRWRELSSWGELQI